MRLTLPTLALLGTSLLAAGCDTNERVDPPNVTVQVVHAAPSMGTVIFKRVQANATPLEFKQGATYSFDVDTYTFNFDVLALDNTVARTISLSATLVEDSTYFLVLREVGGQPEPLLIERPATTQGSGTEVEILHAATTVNAIDVYLDLENFDLSTATSQGTIDFDDVLSPQPLAAGTYQFVLTEAGNRLNILLDSETFSLTGTEGLFAVIVDGAGTGLSPLTITTGDIDGRELVDRNLQSGIRVINALSDRATIDVGIDGQLMVPLITGLAFGTASSFELIAAGSHDFNVTPTQTPGTVEIDEPFEAQTGALATWLITGSAGSMSATLFEDDFRVISGESKLRVFHGSPQNGAVNIFVVAPGTDITTVAPTTAATNAVISDNLRVAPGDYEITVTDLATGAVLAGPIAATIAADGYYGILLTDAAAGTGIEATLLFDF